MKNLKLQCPLCIEGTLIYCAVPELSKNYVFNPTGPTAKLGVCCDHCQTIFGDSQISVFTPWLVERMSEIKTLVDFVFEMRQAQANAIKEKTEIHKRQAKTKEEIVDKMLASIIKEQLNIINFKPDFINGHYSISKPPFK